MKNRNLLRGLLLALASVTSVQAATVTYSYTATVSGLHEYSSATGLNTDLSSYTYNEGKVSIGDKITGYFSYESTAFYDAGCCSQGDRAYFSNAPKFSECRDQAVST